MNDFLRKEVKLLKAIQGISYKEIAELMEMRQSSLYNWLSGNYNLGIEKQEHLQFLIDTLKEG